MNSYSFGHDQSIYGDFNTLQGHKIQGKCSYFEAQMAIMSVYSHGLSNSDNVSIDYDSFGHGQLF